VAVDIPEETINDLLRRLRRVEGQLRGIQQMLIDGRECRDVVTQISAASKALDQTGFKLVASGLTYCLSHPEAAADEGYDIADVQKMFMKLA
jgi:DNA-binding FrmR family transcriptional regulator